MPKARVEIVVNGLVQGVGFRYFVLREAQALGLTGYVKNLYSGEVYTVAEGEKGIMAEFIKKIRTGPMYSDVRGASVKWTEFQNEFKRFEIRY
ncbi:MAG: acylphosphatase [Melioribacteraceae bacterium]|nr:acylphosphatase [Melioribacteraceae bacterium]